MKAHDFIQILVYLVVLVALTPVLGAYMAKVFKGERHLMKPVFGWMEKLIYRFLSVDEKKEDGWKRYLFDLLIFNFLGFLVVFALQLTQRWLPLNPQKLQNVPWPLAFNTAVSFMTNTNWQAYAGESTLSYLVQMTALTVQNFMSAATGIAVLLALIRGITRKTSETIGNFWVDLTKTTLYILLPLSILLAVVLTGEGVVQNFNHYSTAYTLQGATQVIPQGPAASQIAIKQMGTNGGGFFNVNSAHPFENPTPFTNFLEMLSILLIASSLTYSYGKMTGSIRQGWTLFITMMILLVTGLAISLYSEYHMASLFQNHALMEGKETRFGVVNSVLWSVVTTDASNGSVNAMHDSLSPLAGMVAMFNIMLGEIIFGGVGSGLYGMIVFVILTVFIAGLMVGRTPEYLGKKIGAFEVQMSILAVLAPAIVILVFSAIACITPAGWAGITNPGAHGFSQILYAFSSAAGNNGSAFAGLNANSVFYNLMIALGMLIGRFGVIIPVMAISGNLVRKKITPPSSGTFPTDNWLFVTLLIGVILIVGGLTFFPALSLGPIVDHLLLKGGILF
ncbi:MAG TPA: potassium-transporting ATPase subunit KdpA [Bacteroidales bacterium]|nr:potassium-transporting ATPase subunit KdpA [Bacteroidales bacterium]